jgi:hypothetical protein
MNKDARLFYNVHRWYGAGVGRYGQVDPEQVATFAAEHKYGYAFQRPTGYLDQDGRAPALYNPSVQGMEIPLWFGRCIGAPILASVYQWLSAGAGPRWAHCFTSCEIAKCAGKDAATKLGDDKELFDLFMCTQLPRHGWLRKIQQRHCHSAFQPTDFADNQLGRECPPKRTCEQHCARLFTEPDKAGGPLSRYGELP